MNGGFLMSHRLRVRHCVSNLRTSPLGCTFLFSLIADKRQLMTRSQICCPILVKLLNQGCWKSQPQGRHGIRQGL